MDRYKATKILAKELAKHNGQTIISDQNYMKKLLDESDHVYASGNPIEFGAYFCTGTPRQTFYDLTNEARFPNLEEFIEANVTEEANYLFDSRNPISRSSLVKGTLTPYLIIGIKEIEYIRRKFYKNYNLKIREAVSSLGIKDYFELYNLYSSEKNFAGCLEFSKFRQETISFLSQMIYDKDSEVNLSNFTGIHQIDKLNSTLKRLGIHLSLKTKNNNGKWIQKQNITNLIAALNKGNPNFHNLRNNINDEKLIHDFYRFAFEMPYENQNIESNKSILKRHSQILDINLILLKEFQGKHFKEYFEVLDAENQKIITRLIKSSGIKNTVNNSFLWSKGFREIKLDHMNLYMEDADRFIEYFESSKQDDKKTILKDIMSCDYTNKTADDWLNENEIELIRETSFSDETK